MDYIHLYSNAIIKYNFNIYGERSHESKTAWIHRSHDGALNGPGVSQGKGSDVWLQGGSLGCESGFSKGPPGQVTHAVKRSQGPRTRVCACPCAHTCFADP